MNTQWKKVNDEEKVHIKISKSLYERLNNFCNKSVESEIEREMTEWVEIMEDEEKETEEKRFKVYLVESDIPSFSYTEIINTREEDKNNGFVGASFGVCSKEVLLTIAENYGILEDEIEFICSR